MRKELNEANSFLNGLTQEQEEKDHYWMVEYDQVGMSIVGYLGLITDDEAQEMVDAENSDKMTTGGYALATLSELQSLKQQIDNELAKVQ